MVVIFTCCVLGAEFRMQLTFFCQSSIICRSVQRVQDQLNFSWLLSSFVWRFTHLQWYWMLMGSSTDIIGYIPDSYMFYLYFCRMQRLYGREYRRGKVSTNGVLILRKNMRILRVTCTTKRHTLTCSVKDLFEWILDCVHKVRNLLKPEFAVVNDKEQENWFIFRGFLLCRIFDWIDKCFRRKFVGRIIKDVNQLAVTART